MGMARRRFREASCQPNTANANFVPVLARKNVEFAKEVGVSEWSFNRGIKRIYEFQNDEPPALSVYLQSNNSAKTTKNTNKGNIWQTGRNY